MFSFCRAIYLAEHSCFSGLYNSSLIPAVVAAYAKRGSKIWLDHALQFLNTMILFQKSLKQSIPFCDQYARQHMTKKQNPKKPYPCQKFLKNLHYHIFRKMGVITPHTTLCLYHCTNRPKIGVICWVYLSNNY